MAPEVVDPDDELYQQYLALALAEDFDDIERKGACDDCLLNAKHVFFFGGGGGGGGSVAV